MCVSSARIYIYIKDTPSSCGEGSLCEAHRRVLVSEFSLGELCSESALLTMHLRVIRRRTEGGGGEVVTSYGDGPGDERQPSPEAGGDVPATVTSQKLPGPALGALTCQAESKVWHA